MMREKPDLTHEGIHREYEDGVFGEAWVLHAGGSADTLLTLLHGRSAGEPCVGFMHTINSGDDCYYDVYAFAYI